MEVVSERFYYLFQLETFSPKEPTNLRIARFVKLLLFGAGATRRQQGLIY